MAKSAGRTKAEGGETLTSRRSELVKIEESYGVEYWFVQIKAL